MRGGGGVAVFLLVLGTSCRGAANDLHCARFTDHYNELECTGAWLSTRSLCVEALNDPGCDMAPYFRCLEETLRCEDDVLVGDPATCAPMCAE